MNEFEIQDEELELSLAALESEDDKPCGCSDKTAMETDNPFGLEEFSESDDLIAELDFALNSIESGGEMMAGDALSSDAFELEMMGGTSEIKLEDLIALTEKNPGLKITISHL